MCRFLSHVARFHSDFQIKCDSMELLTYIRAKIKHAVDSLYEFDSSQAPISIARNTNCAQALLNNAAFIYRVCLIASHLLSTEHRYMVHRISDMASTHVIHIEAP